MEWVYKDDVKAFPKSCQTALVATVPGITNPLSKGGCPVHMWMKIETCIKWKICIKNTTDKQIRYFCALISNGYWYAISRFYFWYDNGKYQNFKSIFNCVQL